MRGLTVLQLGTRISRGLKFTNQLLADLEAQGLVECVEGEWRLTEWAERAYGRALRSFEPTRERWVNQSRFLAEDDLDQRRGAA
jgi:hypothetical protein